MEETPLIPTNLSGAGNTLQRSTIPLLMIFVDGFPFRVLQQEDFYIKRMPHVSSLQPGFGYSVNIFAELYAGLTPDQAGYLNIWELNQSGGSAPTGFETPSFLNQMSRRLTDRLTRKPQQFSRFVHKIYERMAGEGNIGNIPFEYFPYFRRGTRDDTLPYIFDELGMKAHRHEKIPGSIWDRDESAFHFAMDSIGKGENVFVTFGSLDHTGHLAGPGSDKFIERAALIDKWCEEMIESFLSTHSDNGYIVFCSDHGHATTDAAFELNLEKEFGRPAYGKYWYFIDSTMARVWVKNPQLSDEISQYLGEQDGGTLLDAESRAAHGISSNDFMDAIFVLDEGKVMWPSWTGGWFPKGMHGYMPEAPSQQGVFIFHCPKGEPDIELSIPTRSREVYQFICDITR